MRTTKPISTISFNTESYLQGILDTLVKSHKITAYHFIKHEPEEDEKKPHFHVWILPSKMIQTEDLREALKEFDPEHPDKPLGCLPFESSNFDNWYMYVLHDVRYLAQKGQSRKYHYSRHKVVTSDEDFLDEQVRQIDLLKLSPYQDMSEAMEHGVSWEEYFSRGTVPIPQVRQYQEAWFLLLDNYRKTQRGPYAPHSDDTYTEEQEEDGSSV